MSFETDSETAHADLEFCTQFTQAGSNLTFPGFVPWGDPTSRPLRNSSTSNYGLVGDVIASMVIPGLFRGAYLTKMRRCMEPMGYVRYPMSKSSWDMVHGPNQAQSIQQQARLASGIKPSYAEAIQ